MIVFGIDPGYDRVGWGVIDRGRRDVSYIDCGIIQTNKNDSYLTRLQQLSTQLREILDSSKPDVIVIESLFFATNKKTAIDVAQARGAILLVCMEIGCEIQEYTPLQIKSRVTGDGHADKRAVEKMVRLQLKNVPKELVDDTLDALACAISGKFERL